MNDKLIKEAEIDESAWLSLAAFNRLVKGRQVVFFGVSDYWTEKTLKTANVELVYLVDNSESLIGSTFKGYDIKSPKVLRDKSNDVFVIT